MPNFIISINWIALSSSTISRTLKRTYKNVPMKISEYNMFVQCECNKLRFNFVAITHPYICLRDGVTSMPMCTTHMICSNNDEHRHVGSASIAPHTYSYALDALFLWIAVDTTFEFANHVHSQPKRPRSRTHDIHSMNEMLNEQKICSILNILIVIYGQLPDKSNTTEVTEKGCKWLTFGQQHRNE